MSEKAVFLKEQFARAGMSLSEIQISQFLLYYDLLIEKNKVMNLTTITDYNDVVIKHFIDSIYVINYIRISDGSYILDLGSGAGFPGIPLAILFPSARFTLADSLNKRVLFMQDVVARLKLPHVECIHGRAEDIGHDKDRREHYDFVLSRAVASLPSLCEYCLPFVKKGGLFISYKGRDTQEEFASAQHAIRELGAKTDRDPVEYFLPGTDQKRTLIFIRKTLNTPKKYPRKAGIPGKNPL